MMEELNIETVPFIRTVLVTSRKDGKDRVLRVEQKVDHFTLTPKLKQEILDEIESFYLSEDQNPDIVLVPMGKIKKRLPRYLWGMTLRMFNTDILFVPYLKRILAIEYTAYNERVKTSELIKDV